MLIVHESTTGPYLAASTRALIRCRRSRLCVSLSVAKSSLASAISAWSALNLSSRLGLGRQDRGRAELIEVGARLDRWQRACGLDRLAHRRGIGAAEDVAERSELVEALVETRCLQVQRRLGVLAPHTRGFASLFHRTGPRCRVGIQPLLHALPGVIGITQAGRMEGPGDRLLSRSVPRDADAIGDRMACRYPPLARRVHAHGNRARRRSRDSPNEPPPLSLRGIRAQRRQKLLHRRGARLPLDRQARENHLVNPRRDPGPLGRVSDSALQRRVGDLFDLLSLERSLPIERAVQRGAKGKDVRARVDLHFVRVLLRRHVSRRSLTTPLSVSFGSELTPVGNDDGGAGSSLPFFPNGRARPEGGVGPPLARSSELRASPKSVTRGLPSVPRTTLASLKSRWMIPSRCAAASPSPASQSSDTICLQLRPPSVSQSASVPPPAISIARKTRPSLDSPTSCSITTFGCDSCAMAVASRINRARHSAVSLPSAPSRRNLSATRRCSSESYAA